MAHAILDPVSTMPSIDPSIATAISSVTPTTPA
jgi:hypothetical protein